ncbi:Rrf2 family transcriptional regulator [Maritimibacter sp. DP1N21-5]|uniref:RrF2 family transcriptional regulator n=1 Tax=Maritimibacter sp. DP1N21-5 TaxID=2836867 RepID=UPI001C446C6F|nr:Rrf2 family transcriptional regulator [Maritimibacter sp. DP1N21-5]MBV7408092.1 Rrf2 family transcriptional regulator [Maritimibacter sp. DP1N21-5]
MKRDSRLSWVLHALLHMAQADRTITSDQLAGWMDTNPVVVRRTMGLLREAGLVSSAKGPGGGWVLSSDPTVVTLRRLHEVLGEPAVFAIGVKSEAPDCLVEAAVNRRLTSAMAEAETLLLARLEDITLANLLSDFENDDGLAFAAHRDGPS